MKSSLALLSLPALGLAVPSFMNEGPDFEKRQLLGSLGNTIAGILGSVAESVNPDNKRPEPGFEFQAPGPDDSRGPCPGLNLLANYGYLPRDGYVSLGQVIEATSRGFNMDADLSTLLGVFAVLTDGNITTESWYLGSGPNFFGGLNRHSTVEADISPNREDYYLGCGDAHHLSSRIFKQNVQLAAASADKDFGLETMGNQWAANAQFSQQNNPFLYFFPFPSIVTLGAYPFYPQFFSNGTYGAGGRANYESISSIIGAKYNSQTGDFEYVPEKWPENWYRRATPYGAVTTIFDILTSIYPKFLLPMAIPQIGSDNLSPQTILCDVYQGLNSIAPLAVAGSAQTAEDAITWALSKLDPVFTGTTLGCASGAISKNTLYPNANVTGGPLSPPNAVVDNTGNNVYNKVYFTRTPTNPPKC